MSVDRMPGPWLLWLDMETTGLDPDFAEPLELAYILTKEDLVPVDAQTFVLMPSYTAVRSMDQEVRRMHLASGLMADIEAREPVKPITDRENVDQTIRERVDIECGAEQVTVCGSGVERFDMRFLERYFPFVFDRVTYFAVDISSLRRVMRLSGAPVEEIIPDESYGQTKKHRALPDAYAHLEEFRRWRDYLRELWTVWASRS